MGVWTQLTMMGFRGREGSSQGSAAFFFTGPAQKKWPNRGWQIGFWCAGPKIVSAHSPSHVGPTIKRHNDWFRAEQHAPASFPKPRLAGHARGFSYCCVDSVAALASGGGPLWLDPCDLVSLGDEISHPGILKP